MNNKAYCSLPKMPGGVAVTQVQHYKGHVSYLGTLFYDGINDEEWLGYVTSTFQYYM
jgi:hypothetical protein